MDQLYFEKILKDLLINQNLKSYFELNFSKYFQQQIKLEDVLGLVEKASMLDWAFESLNNNTATFVSEDFRLNIGVDENFKINYLWLLRPKDDLVYSKNLYRLPFNSKWFTFWGGAYLDINYHDVPKQYFAYDFLILDSKFKSFKSSGKFLEDYYCFNEPILSVLDGEVINMADNLKDIQIGDSDTNNTAGNFIVIKHSNSEYSFYAHLKNKSISVKVGQRVSVGEQIALCGNSGNSSEPHLHFQIMDRSDFTTCKTRLVRFENVKVNNTPKLNYSPIKGDYLSEQ